MHESDAVVCGDTVVDMNDVVPGFEVLKIREKRCDVLASPMLLRQMFRLIEDIGLCINLQADVGQPQTTGYLADSDDRCGWLIRCSQRLLTKLGAERNAVFVQEIAQA